MKAQLQVQYILIRQLIKGVNNTQRVLESPLWRLRGLAMGRGIIPGHVGVCKFVELLCKECPSPLSAVGPSLIINLMGGAI